MVRNRNHSGNTPRNMARKAMARLSLLALPGLAALTISTPYPGLMGAVSPIPSAHAQESSEVRIKKLEAEIRALQRKVFPDGAGRYVEPEISAAQAQSQPNNTSTALTDLLLRVDSLEQQIAKLTALSEQNDYRLRQIEDRLVALELKAEKAEQTEPETQGAATAPAAVDPVESGGNGAATAATNSAGGGAIEIPDTGDAGEDSYIYGYRLWDAKRYGEAQTQLEKTVKTYPKHARISHARNLLGRAYLDDGKPGNAVKVFYDNYQQDPKGARAPDSLYFLGTALIKLDKKEQACTAFKELEEVYPDIASGRLADRLAAGKRDAKCK